MILDPCLRDQAEHFYLYPRVISQVCIYVYGDLSTSISYTASISNLTNLKMTNKPPHGKTNNLHRRKTKTQISFAVTAKLISAFVFATRIVQFLFYLNPKFQASSSFLCLYRPVCVRPVRKPHCWFSHEAAQIMGQPHYKYLTIANLIIVQPWH